MDESERKKGLFQQAVKIKNNILDLNQISFVN